MKLMALWRRFFQSKTAILATIILFVFVIIAILAPILAPQDPYDLTKLDIMDSLLPPGSTNFEGTMTYWLGTDGLGRDLLSSIFYGLRLSLFVGIVSAFLAFILGSILGLLAAYFGGVIDSLIMRLVDLLLSLPSILIALMILAFLGKSILNVILVLVIVEWAYYARTIRSQALSERRKEYIEAALGLGLPTYKIIFSHLFPNALPPLIVLASLQVARAITLEATLSFLGLGVPITEPSLGLLISNGFAYLLSDKYWITFFPGIVLALTILMINLIGDNLRNILNPRGHYANS